MAGKHKILLVEDDQVIASAVSEHLRVLGYDCVHAASFDEARELISAGDFCGIITDLGILAFKESAKPDRELGFELIALARKIYWRTSEEGHSLMPIIAMSAHDQHPFMRKAVRSGVDDFLRKPLDDNQVSLKDTVRELLQKAGREDHARCAELTALARRAGSSAPAPAGDAVAGGSAEPLRLGISGRTAGNRIEVTLNGKGVAITLASFKVLLRLIEGRLRKEEWTDKDELGARVGDGFKGISVLAQELKPHIADGVQVTENNRLGGYRLHEGVALDALALDGFVEHPDPRTRELAVATLKVIRPKRARA